jgi:hypothetical protein
MTALERKTQRRGSMSAQHHFAADIYNGLQALADRNFPRKCVSCGRVYATVEEFLSQTKGLAHSSGLKSATMESTTVIELYRNCPCGSTLLELFGDRRDSSEAGAERRERFGRLLEMLGLQFGLNREEARMELLKILRGQRSPLLEHLGIKPRS